MDDTGAWGRCTNDKALSMQIVSVAKLDLPQETIDLVQKQAGISYAGHVFGCIYHEGLDNQSAPVDWQDL
jgi:hypothetical protein